MAVTVRVPGLWRRKCGGAAQVDLPPANLGEILEALVERFPGMRPEVFDERGAVRPSLNLFVNCEQARYLGGLSTPVQDGDEVYIVPLITGGCR